MIGSRISPTACTRLRGREDDSFWISANSEGYGDVVKLLSEDGKGNGRAVRFVYFLRIFRVASALAYWNLSWL
jgi:hypothetical protein